MKNWKDKNATDRASEAEIKSRVDRIEAAADARAVEKTVIDPRNRGSIRRTAITSQKEM